MKIVSIEGNIGSGKSTLVEYLKKNKETLPPNVIYISEPVDIWNEIKDSSGMSILEKYYQDQKKYAFPFQMMAYITRLSVIRKIFETSPKDSIIISERSIYTDHEIFAKMLHDAGKIEDIEYSIYLKWFHEFSESVLHGIIYVKTHPETCIERIGIRNRKGESTISKLYIEECDRYHENWINSTEIPVLVMDGQPEQSEYTIEQIKEFIKRI